MAGFHIGQPSGAVPSQANTWSALQTYLSEMLAVSNPAETFAYRFVGGAIAANRDILLPVLTANDSLVFASLAQTLANKTLTAPTIADLSNAQHDHTIAADGGPVMSPFGKIEPNAGITQRWSIPGWQVHNSSGQVVIIGSNQVEYIPIYVARSTTYIRIGVSVSTAAAGTLRLGIYSWSNGNPGTLLLNAGTVDTGTTGDKEIIISHALQPGFYFLAGNVNAQPTMRCLGVVGSTAPVHGFSSSLGNSLQTGPNVTCLIQASVTGSALPASPAPTTMGTRNVSYITLRE